LDIEIFMNLVTIERFTVVVKAIRAIGLEKCTLRIWLEFCDFGPIILNFENENEANGAREALVAAMLKEP
jgi:hypothetical protein